MIDTPLQYPTAWRMTQPSSRTGSKALLREVCWLVSSFFVLVCNFPVIADSAVMQEETLDAHQNIK